METTIDKLGHRYRIIDKLGSGGMGAVYRAFDHLNREDVALKMVLTEPNKLAFNSRIESASNTDNLRVALAREFQSLASLHHPHVITVLDYGFDAHHLPYFTMELLKDAQTIRDVAQKQPRPIQVSL